MLRETKTKWIDENNNSWDKNKYSEEDAIRLSKTLLYCSNCSDCSNFKENPERIYSSKIGSRKSNTKVYFNSEKTLVVCGCFQGNLKEFEERVNTVHKGTVYQKEYNNFIEKVKKYISD